MFERYTEGARRVLFFARYEASERGAMTIETEHLLVGITRDSSGLATRTFAALNVSLEDLRHDVDRSTVAREKFPVSLEIPFTGEVKRALQAAAEESDRLAHKHVGTEHLLLGLLREEQSVAASILAARGVRLNIARDTVARLSAELPTSPPPAPTGVSTFEEVENIRHLVEQLARMARDPGEARALADRIRDALDELFGREDE
jgi:ATP-dependent Clp protease ATP-binding subunit ClpC